MKDFLEKLRKRRFKEDAPQTKKDRPAEQKTKGIIHELKTSVRKR